MNVCLKNRGKRFFLYQYFVKFALLKSSLVASCFATLNRYTLAEGYTNIPTCIAG